MGWSEAARDAAAVARAQAREERMSQRAARQSAAGIPDSVPFGGDPEAELHPILDCHVGGVLVRDMPIESQSRILYQQTDEGIAEYNRNRVEGAARVVSDGWSKALDQRRDDVRDREMDSYEARDPMREVYDKHIQPGMRGKFLSARRVKENGGTGDYEVVKDENGSPVTVRGMILGQMPERKAKARNRHYQDRSGRLLSEITERYKAEGGPTAAADQ